jgi:murein DD-endopeptidase MepM/ murein hydrolase activator NlpD
VLAAADGTIAYVGHTLQSYGNLVLIRHGGGMITAYAHMNAVSVKQGMHVRRGEPIGSVGSTGTVAHAQLHFEVRHGTDTIDPRQYLG